MEIPNFLSPRFVGERFNDHSIPVELLGDLAVLQAMVIDVAKWIYLKENPGRKRSPRGFADGISLTLTSIDQGSVIPRLALVLGIGVLLSPQREYAELARDAIVDAIGAAEAGQSVTNILPGEMLAYFDRIGRGLRDDEAIEFATRQPGRPARLTKKARRRLLMASEVKELTETVRLRGAIHEVNLASKTFQFTLEDGKKTSGFITSQHYNAIMDAVNGFVHGTKVQMDVVGRFDRSARLQGIQSIEHVTILDPLDVPSRLDDLKSLEDGWLDGVGMAPPPDGLDWLARAFNDHYPDTLPLPYVYPVAEGDVRFEWSLRPNEVSLEIRLGDHSADWHLLNLETDEEESRALNLASDESWNWLAGRLRDLGGVDV